jgi:ribosomal protein S25
VSRRVITISRKKWGKSAAKTERIIRDAIIKADTESGIDEYLKKAKSVTSYDLANRFNIRISIARKILREKETAGMVVPYIKEGGFVVYTTPAEIEKREGGAPIMVADALEEVASSVPKKKTITDEMDVALVAAGTPGVVKPSRLARKRREAGAKKERKDERPEVIVEPLVQPEVATPTPEVKTTKKAPAKKKAAPKKKTPAKKKAVPKKKAPAKKKAEEKKPAKKPVKKKDEPKKKAPATKKAAPKKKAPVKKKDEKKAAPKKKAPAKKKAEEKKPAKKPAKKTAAKKADAKKPAKKKPAKKK